MDDIREYLARAGYPGHVVQGGAEHLVKGWELVAAEVARGVPQGEFDYMNDLDGRTILHEIIDLLAKDRHSALRARIDAADDRIRPHLVANADCLCTQDSQHEVPRDRDLRWWCYMRPRVSLT